MLNLTLLREEYKTAVHCPEEWMPESLLRELKSEFGSGVYTGAVEWWDMYGDKTCYWPKIKGKEFVGIEYCRRGWFEENGYRVLDFYDVVCMVQDYGEFHTAQFDEAALFGIL